jgi:hypothetical protein
MYYMQNFASGREWSRKSLLGMRQAMSAPTAEKPRDELALTRVSPDRMDEIALAWRARALEGDPSADLVADVLESVAGHRREKAGRSRLQTIRLGLAALTRY